MKRKMFGVLAIALLLAAAGLTAQAKGKAKGELTGQININEASVEQLTMLPGIGVKRAKMIQQYVSTHPFKSVEELKNINGIGDAALAKLKPFVTVAGPSTAKWVKASPVTSNN